MKKKIFFTIFCWLNFTILFAQSWSELGKGSNALNANGFITTLGIDSKGNIYAAGVFVNSNWKYYVAKWDGITWSELKDNNSLDANGTIMSIGVDLIDNIYATGQFTNSKGNFYVAKWDGASWSELGKDSNALNANTYISCLCIDKFNNIYVGGAFTNSNGKNYIAKWNGKSWNELGVGKDALINTDINSIVTDTIGNIYTVGNFKNSFAKDYVAKWDGNNWSMFDTSSARKVGILFSDATGNLYGTGGADSAGKFSVAKWDGINWNRLGILDAYLAIYSVCSDQVGNVYAGGYFKNSKGYSYVAKWDGINWTELGGLNALKASGIIYSILSDKSGNIYAAGSFGNNVVKYGYGIGINNIKSKNQFEIFPNPTSNNFTIQFSSLQKEELAIYNMLGGKIFSDFLLPSQTQCSIDFAAFHKGLYIVKIGEATKHLVIE